MNTGDEISRIDLRWGHTEVTAGNKKSRQLQTVLTLLEMYIIS